MNVIWARILFPTSGMLSALSASSSSCESFIHTTSSTLYLTCTCRTCCLTGVLLLLLLKQDCLSHSCPSVSHPSVCAIMVNCRPHSGVAVSAALVAGEDSGPRRSRICNLCFLWLLFSANCVGFVSLLN